MAEDFLTLIKGLKFDASRWNLNELKADSAAQPLVSLTGFESDMSAFQEMARADLEQSLSALQGELQSLADVGKQRIESLRTMKASVEEQLSAATEPPKVKADPAAFQLVVRVTDASGKTGLPGVAVRIVSPKTSKTGATPVAEGITDTNGNAVVSLSKAHLEGAGNDALSVEVGRPGGDQKVIQTAAKAVRPKPGSVETVVINVPAKADIAGELESGKQMLSQLNESLQEFTSREKAHEVRQAALTQELTGRIGEIQKLLETQDPPKT
jgi:hypothetical protein